MGVAGDLLVERDSPIGRLDRTRGVYLRSRPAMLFRETSHI